MKLLTKLVDVLNRIANNLGSLVDAVQDLTIATRPKMSSAPYLENENLDSPTDPTGLHKMPIKPLDDTEWRRRSSRLAGETYGVAGTEPDFTPDHERPTADLKGTEETITFLDETEHRSASTWYCERCGGLAPLPKIIYSSGSLVKTATGWSHRVPATDCREVTLINNDSAEVASEILGKPDTNESPASVYCSRCSTWASPSAMLRTGGGGFRHKDPKYCVRSPATPTPDGSGRCERCGDMDTISNLKYEGVINGVRTWAHPNQSCDVGAEVKVGGTD